MKKKYYSRFNPLSFQTFRMEEEGTHQSIQKSETGLGHQNRVLIKGVSNQGCPTRESEPQLKCKHIQRSSYAIQVTASFFFFISATHAPV